ncbi:hypothetical protein B566_EDAN019362, partial [Ephemera danica]
MGPEALRVAGIGPVLQSHGLLVHDCGNLQGPANPWQAPVDGYRHLPEVVAWNAVLHQAVYAELALGRLPVVLGGDHCLGLGSISAVARHCQETGKRLRVLWLDAHADFNTATLTPSGNIHGMPVACLLDANNRRLVAQGLKRVRAGAMPAGMAALFKVAARQPHKATGFDFGFALGPRLADMTLGIECLCTDDAGRAEELAHTLDGINRERKAIEGEMRDQALLMAEAMFDETEAPPAALVVFDPDFHEGVVGIVASRLKDKMHRPTFVFAASGAQGRENELKGSGRSIAGFHLRDALDLVAKRHPGVLLRFGGHAMAAG